ncbi:DnaD domain protein [Lachnoclostridium sp. An181]|uniref:DnaD domain protein n=1 Tax=Lachnoclostridium sp. An181 TaxID=1965575 RepID=UPI000B38CEF4|nr:DnaD domain protein [Lachnoclostridium sp. An181]OUP50343.1 DNA replication protein DnaD [Lachnoclostridium sp. An181]
MQTVTLKCRESRQTIIENMFIDHHMAKANGEYVKVYLLLLRYLQNPDSPVTIAFLADCLENTEKDILRALLYWQKTGLLSVLYDTKGEVCSIEFGKSEKAQEAPAAQTPASSGEEKVQAKKSADSLRTPAARSGLSEPIPAISNPKKNSLRSHKEFRQLVFVAEQYLGKTLTKTDLDTINYFYDELNFSVDLIEYLIEYCVDNGHRSIHYIQKVGLSWSEQKITTVEDARMISSRYNKNCYSVLNAFGIKGRGPALAELDFIRKWTEEYGFELEVIIEACNRTITNTHQPSFEYADKILQNWRMQNIRHLSDVAKSDALFQKDVAVKQRAVSHLQPAVSGNKFNNFQGRTYDMDSLEEQLLNSHS